MREIGIFVPSSLRIHVILLALMLHNFVGLASTAFPVPWCVGPVGQYAGEKPATDLEIRVYPGVDGDFTLYADEGTNYNYEKGMRSTIRVHWNDAKRELTIGQRNGQFFGMLQSKQFKIVAVDASSVRQVRYDGKKVARIQQLQLHRNGDNPVLLDTVYAKSTAAGLQLTTVLQIANGTWNNIGPSDSDDGANTGAAVSVEDLTPMDVDGDGQTDLVLITPYWNSAASKLSTWHLYL